ncbi:MAG: hypothetical protein AAF705_09010, partial [Bacteroidota bacterium]
MEKRELTSKIVNESELIEEWDFFLKTECPTLAKGDFNGDGLEDFAFIATSKNPEPYQLLIAQSKNESFDLVKVMDIGFGIYDVGLGFGIEKIPKNQIKGIDKEVRLKYDGILFKKFESSARIIYFDGNQYQEVWIGDWKTSTATRARPRRNASSAKRCPIGPKVSCGPRLAAIT